MSWIKNFLYERTQKVIVGCAESKWSDVLSGVPQGSVLGPLFFVICINDLPDEAANKTKLFADDSKKLSVIKEPENNLSLQEDLRRVCDWSNT